MRNHEIPGAAVPRTGQRSVLVIDDDPDFAPVIGKLIGRHGYRVESALRCPALIKSGEFTAIILDRNLDGVDGIEELPNLRAMAPNVPIILMTVEQSVDVVVRAIKSGAFDYIAKPPSEERLVATLHKAAEYHQMAAELSAGNQHAIGFGEIIGSSNAMRAVYRAISNVAPTDVSVLICGDTGTGKELVAQTIHQQSLRSKGPFVALNMAGLPTELVESTLFGHERGAFSGADKKRIGACEEAGGGTLFLDEITEMPQDLQAKLLRFLQERTICRVGGTGDISTDLRVLSATNRDPMEAVRSGKLRLDLFYRLNVVPINLPSLKDRPGDVELLSRRFLHTLALRHGKQFDAIDDETLFALAAYGWPGNVRQLHHVIERMVVTNSGPVVRAYMLPEEVRTALFEGERASASGSVPVVMASRGLPTLAPTMAGTLAVVEPKKMDDIERDALATALARCNGSATQAAKQLGISPATMYRKIKTYALN